MLEFAYTGEVNVAQDLLPSLLHTARCFKIKGLDKVESPVEQPVVSLTSHCLIFAYLVEWNVELSIREYYLEHSLSSSCVNEKFLS